MSLKTKVAIWLAKKVVKKAVNEFDDWLDQGGFKKTDDGLEAPKDTSGLQSLLPIAVVGVAAGAAYLMSHSSKEYTPAHSKSFWSLRDVKSSTDLSAYQSSFSSTSSSSVASKIRGGYFTTAQGKRLKWTNKSQRLCGAGTVSALSVLGVNVKRTAKAKDLGPSLIAAGYTSICTYSIPAHGNLNAAFQLGDVLVFNNHNHAEVYVPGVSGSGWVSDFFQEHTNPYRTSATVTLYRLCKKPNSVELSTASQSSSSQAASSSSLSSSSSTQASSSQQAPVTYYEQTELSKSQYNERH